MLLMAAGLLSFGQSGLQWHNNYFVAQAEAKEQHRHILMSFSGSDWCANCKRLEHDLFSTTEFATFAAENLVLLQLDFPAKKQNRLSPEQTEHNKKMAETYNKEGVFPLVLILDEDGRVVGRMKHPGTSTDDYINSILSFMK